MPGKEVLGLDSEWFERRYSRWVKAPRSVLKDEGDLEKCKSFGDLCLTEAISHAGYKEAPGAVREMHVTDSHSDFFISNEVALLHETAVWLTKRQEWELRSSELQSIIQEYEGGIVLARETGRDHEGDLANAEDVLRMENQVARWQAEVDQLQAELSAMGE